MDSLYSKPIMIQCNELLNKLKNNIKDDEDVIIFNSLNKSFRDPEIMKGLMILYDNDKSIQWATTILLLIAQKYVNS